MSDNIYLLLFSLPLSVLTGGIAFEVVRRLISRQLRQETIRTVKRLGLTETIRRELQTPRIRKEVSMMTQSVPGPTVKILIDKNEVIQTSTSVIAGEEQPEPTKYFGGAPVQGSRIHATSATTNGMSL